METAVLLDGDVLASLRAGEIIFFLPSTWIILGAGTFDFKPFVSIFV